jgi:hypothetical protein
MSELHLNYWTPYWLPVGKNCMTNIVSNILGWCMFSNRYLHFMNCSITAVPFPTYPVFYGSVIPPLINMKSHIWLWNLCGNLPQSNTQSLLLRSTSSNFYSFGQTILTLETTRQNAVFIHHGAQRPQLTIAEFGYKYEGCKHARVSHDSASIPATTGASKQRLDPAYSHLT